MQNHTWGMCVCVCCCCCCRISAINNQLPTEIEVAFSNIKNIWQPKHSLDFTRIYIFYYIGMVAHWSSGKYTVFCLLRVGKTTGFLTGSGIAGALNKFDLSHILWLFISTWRACPNCVDLLMKENHNLKRQRLSQLCFPQVLLFQQTLQFLLCVKWSALFWAWTPPAVLSCFWLHARWGKNCTLGSVGCWCETIFALDWEIWMWIFKITCAQWRWNMAAGIPFEK